MRRLQSPKIHISGKGEKTVIFTVFGIYLCKIAIYEKNCSVGFLISTIQHTAWDQV